MHSLLLLSFLYSPSLILPISKTRNPNPIMFSSNDHQLNHPAVPIMEIDGRWKAHVQQAPNCPRCASTNTKFCYYNNYSLAQPRYYCKACKRYWTKGGSLRNVPVGGGCRKTRRSRAKPNSSHHNSADAIPFPPQTNAPEIDLAAVFARYVNHDSGLPSSSVSVTEQDVEMVTHNIDQNQYLFDDLQSFDHGLLQTEDVFWSTSEDGSSLSSSGFAAWDPVAHQEELDSSPLELYGSVLDDQFGVSTSSLLSDINWSCFDQAGYLD